MSTIQYRAIDWCGKIYKFVVRDTADQSVINEIFVQRDYQPIEEIIKNAKSTILDIGAHMGAFTVYVRGLNSKVPIICFEPELGNYKLLRETLAKNSIKANLKLVNSAVAGETDTRQLCVSDDTHSHSLIGSCERIQKVTALSLYEVFRKYGIGKCDLVKMDCERAEFEIIDKAPKEVFDSINALFIEYHLDSDGERKLQLMKTKLGGLGYKVVDSPSRYDKNLGFIFAVKK
jgi:FkbM family methyltransferase